MKRLTFAAAVALAAIAGMVGDAQMEEDPGKLTVASSDLSFLLASIPTASPSTVAVLSASVAQVPSPSIEHLVLEAAPGLDVMDTQESMQRDIRTARQRIRDGFELAYIGMLIDGRLQINSAITLLEGYTAKYAEELARVEEFGAKNTKNSFGWDARAYPGRMILDAGGLRRVAYDINEILMNQPDTWTVETLRVELAAYAAQGQGATP